MQEQGKILTVDDDPNNITIIEELLDDNYDLKTATSGEEALAIVQHFRPDIILLDIMMPGMNGYEACRQLREHCCSEYTKIIMVSARAMVSERLEGYEAGADDYITKPFDGDEFLTKIQHYMDCRQVRKMDCMQPGDINNVADNLKIPLFVARNIISEARTNIVAESNQRLQDQLGIINNCIDCIESIISDYNDFSETNEFKEELKSTPFSMKSMVSDAINKLKPMAASQKIRFTINMPDDELLIKADRLKILNIFETLIEYAIRRNHKSDNINVRVISLEDKIITEIEADGTEINKGTVEENFTKQNESENNDSQDNQGRYLALPIIQSLAELNGCQIYLRNNQEGKTTLIFEIPLSTENEITQEPVLSDIGVNSVPYE